MRVLDFQDDGQRRRERPKRTRWRRKVVEERVTVGLSGKDLTCRSKWGVGINRTAA